MKEPYGEGLASHTDPESCVVSREAGRGALTVAYSENFKTKHQQSLRPGHNPALQAAKAIRHTGISDHCGLVTLPRNPVITRARRSAVMDSGSGISRVGRWVCASVRNNVATLRSIDPKPSAPLGDGSDSKKVRPASRNLEKACLASGTNKPDRGSPS